MIPGQAEITRLMIMLNLFDGVNRPSEIAKNIDITLQGVQYHLKSLKSSELVTEENTISQKGFEYLYSGLNNIRSFVSENIYKLDRVITWEAISNDRINAGDTVYLKMDQGYLTAFKENVSESKGVSISDGEKGGIIGVTRVEGIIDVRVKSVNILITPDVENIRDFDDLIVKISERISEFSTDIVSVIGESALYIAKKLGIRNIVEYAPLEAGFEAARRGMSSLVMVSSRRFRFLLEDLKSLENRNEEVSVKILSI